SRDYQVDGSTAPAARTTPPVVDDAGEPIIDAAQTMRDNGATPLFSQRQVPPSRHQPNPVNQQAGQPTAAVAVYGHPMGQWEFPNLNLASISKRVNKKNLWGDAYGDMGDASFLPRADAPQMRERRSNATYMEAPEPTG